MQLGLKVVCKGNTEEEVFDFWKTGRESEKLSLKLAGCPPEWTREIDACLCLEKV